MRLLLAALLFGLAPQGGPPHISLRWIDDGEAFVSVRVESMPVREVVTLLAHEAGATVEGFHDNQRPAPVTVDLRERPLRESLAAILGSVGLRAEVRSGDVWRVLPLIDADATPEDLERMAYSAFALVAREHRDHPEIAPAAEWAQAEIRERQGNALAARSHYDALVSAHPESSLVPEALLRAGRALAEGGDFQQARQRFENLVRLDRSHELVLPARVALARCAAELGEWQQALWQLDALDRSDPPSDELALRERRHIRARALIDGGRYPEALGILRALELEQPTGEDRLTLLHLLADCYEAVGDPAVAGRAWMAVAEASTGADREEALVRSAELALEAGEPLVTILVQESAVHENATGDTQARLDALAQRAREELDIDVQPATPASRAERGAELIRAGLHAEALQLLDPLLVEESLTQTERTSVLLDVGRCVESLHGKERTIALLREWLPKLEHTADRARVYVFAADLLERFDDLDGAAAALQGRL